MQISQTARPGAIPWRTALAGHVSIARFDHAIKNVFVLPGIILPLLAPVCNPENSYLIRTGNQRVLGD